MCAFCSPWYIQAQTKYVWKRGKREEGRGGVGLLRNVRLEPESKIWVLSSAISYMQLVLFSSIHSRRWGRALSEKARESEREESEVPYTTPLKGDLQGLLPQQVSSPALHLHQVSILQGCTWHGTFLSVTTLRIIRTHAKKEVICSVTGGETGKYLICLEEKLAEVLVGLLRY